MLYITLAPFSNEQSDLVHRIRQDKRLVQLPVYSEFLKLFTTEELMRWPRVEQIYRNAFDSTDVFRSSDELGTKRWNVLRERVVEHNIRVISKYYTEITLKRLEQLLDLGSQESEDFLSRLVVSKTVYARIDRPAGLVKFRPNKDPTEVMNAWAQNMNSMMNLIDRSTHLINREEMMHAISVENKK